MPKELFVDKPKHLIITDYQEAALKGNQVRIQSEFSAIKHGTEFNHFGGNSPFSHKRFDMQLRMFVECFPRDNPVSYKYPGNITVGRIVEVGTDVKNLQVGDRVYAYAPIRQTIEKDEKEVNVLTPPMSEVDAVCTDPAFFALAAVRDADVGVGDHVIIFGLGAIGLFCIQLLRLAGCLEIVAVDPMKMRRDLAERLGATLVLDPRSCDVGSEVRHYLKHGADVAIEGSGSYQALHDAMRSVQMCGRIVTFGFYKGKAAELALGEEWHHNRLTLVSSMPAWNNPSRDHPLWDRERLEYSVKQMFMKRLLTAHDIVTPIVSFDEAPKAYMDIYENAENAIKLGIRFGV